MSDDNPVFLGLISDLFPALDVPRKRELEFEKAVKHSGKRFNRKNFGLSFGFKNGFTFHFDSV